ncbi:MAG: glycolate oxidase subunit GlcF [Pseudomonadales bacterium]|nr:glycolate oxidase subunit GlcF [Pseudomonadales bacterium]NRA18494.1 glycolate oxidase subunit GlcF [Oceanospirillaceae bacterium]
MHTKIHQVFAKSSELSEAQEIIGNCVHCGFCTATCPTYQELKDERDGPRGRIYLIKQFLETGTITEKSRTHLDRCLSCRSCETTCPSGVKYGRLLDIGRSLSEQVLPRSTLDRTIRWSLARVLPNAKLFGALLSLGRLVKPILPAVIKNKIPDKRSASPWPSNSHSRVMLTLAGCAQPATSPNTNAASARVLDKLGISLVEAPRAGCCGAVSYHLSEHQQALVAMRSNIDAWWPAIQAGAEAIVITASGCGAMVQDYGHLLAEDPDYRDKAQRISELCKDLSHILVAEDLSRLNSGHGSVAQAIESTAKIAFHCPCSLQHALGQAGVVEQILIKMGVNLATTTEQHLCCGSAGTYSLLQPKISKKLLAKKIAALNLDKPERIVTANVGCQLHLQTGTSVAVDHWIELVDEIATANNVQGQ